jgi:hypothetical protein
MNAASALLSVAVNARNINSVSPNNHQRMNALDQQVKSVAARESKVG